MKIKHILFFIVLLILLFSCFTPETGPPVILDEEQRLVIENGTYYYDIAEGDTFLVYHLDYYTTRDSCAKGNYSIIWPNIGGIQLNISYAFPVWEYAGIWYEKNGRMPVRESTVESGVDPVYTLEAYNGVKMLTATDTLELVETNSE